MIGIEEPGKGSKMAHNQVLEAILSNKPAEWDDATYINKRYHLVELYERGEEYRQQTGPFINSGLLVTKLQRVQNPFQYGRFIVRKNQLESRGEFMHVVKYYHPVSRVDLEMALEYNMDVRRYQQRLSGQIGDGKNPLFYSSPLDAKNMLQGNSGNAILICNVLDRTNYHSHSTYKSNDTEYMPTYVVTLG